MKLIIYHPQGNANVRASAIAFAEADMLQEYHTSIACFDGTALDTLSKFNVLLDIKRRKLDSILKPFTHVSPYRELGRILSSKVGFKYLVRRGNGLFSIQAVTQSLDKKVAQRLAKSQKKGLTGVYAFEDGAYFSFLEAEQLGIERLYDLPTGYWRAKIRILEKEKEIFPGWQNTITGLFDSPEKLESKDAEIQLADKIFVASQFTAKTLQDYPGVLPPIKVIPYGFPSLGPNREYPFKKNNARLKVLFVGNLSQQKGIANLFAAVIGLEAKVSLTLVGSKVTENCEVLNIELSKHTWIPGLPHDEVLKTMREHDVLVFPTLFDGFGLVISEAMSQGTPVIATYNSAGPDLIENGKNGWLIEAGSIPELRNSIERLIADPSIIEKAGRKAKETAGLRPWSVFKKELSDAVR